MEDIQESVKQFILENILSEAEPDFADETNLLTNGILDSLSTLKLLSYLEDKFGIKFEAADVDENNFRSIANIAQFITMKLAGAP